MSEVIYKSESKFNVFVNNEGKYLAVRNVGLAFGNTGKEIYFVDELNYAYRFYPHITQLNLNDYHHEFPFLLKIKLNNLKVQQIVVKTEYYLNEV